MAAHYPHLPFRHAEMEGDKLNEALVGEIAERFFFDRNFKVRFGHGMHFFGFHSRLGAHFYIHLFTIPRTDLQRPDLRTDAKVGPLSYRISLMYQ